MILCWIVLKLKGNQTWCSNKHETSLHQSLHLSPLLLTKISLTQIKFMAWVNQYTLVTEWKIGAPNIMKIGPAIVQQVIFSLNRIVDILLFNHLRVVEVRE